MRRFFITGGSTAIGLVVALMAFSSPFDRAPGSVPVIKAAPPRIQGLGAPLGSVVQKDQTLSQILAAQGIKPDRHARIVQTLKGVYATHIFPGQEYKITTTPDSLLTTLTLKSRDRCTVYRVTANDTGLCADSLALPLTKITRSLSGTLESSLYSAISSLGESPELIQAMIDLFSWDINWFFDPREGDHFCLVYEKYYCGEEFMKYGRILAATYVNGDRRFTVYHFNPDSVVNGYFNENGVSAKKAFLKAPLTYHHISSLFSRSRLHPILKVYRPHFAVDYAAATGTPVKAAADGVVTSAGAHGGYGNMLSLRHAGSYNSYYGHLSGFARGIHSGNRVRQGDIIGYVGSTGLATGPHLDYRISLNGRFIDPLKMAPPSLSSVPALFAGAFDEVKEKYRHKLLSGEPAYADK